LKFKEVKYLLQKGCPFACSWNNPLANIISGVYNLENTPGAGEYQPLSGEKI
jgi:hypothetical protein